MHPTQERIKKIFISTGPAVAAFLVCLMLLALPGPAAAESTTFIEPLTGSRITLPSEFSDGLKENAGRYTQYKQLRGDGSAYLSVSVEEIFAKSISDVFGRLVSSSYNYDTYAILELNSTFINLDETRTSFGKETYVRHWAWLLDDGSYLYVRLDIEGETHLDIADEIEIEFGAIPDNAKLRLMTEFAAPSRDKEPLAGKWTNTASGVLLEGYGASLLSFRSSGGATLACANGDVFWKKSTRSEKKAQKFRIVTSTPDKLVVSDANGLDGEYVRLADEGSAEVKPPVYDESDLRGKWENDTERLGLEITRRSITINRPNGFSHYGGYEVTDFGLHHKSVDGTSLYVRKTPDGGLTVDGQKGVFYRPGTDKGAGADAGKDEPDCVVTIYQHGDFGGTSQCLQTGSYDIDYLENGDVGNDQLSSLRVAAGYSAILYEHGGFQGESRTVDTDTPNIGGAWNDRVSSIVVEKR